MTASLCPDCRRPVAEPVTWETIEAAPLAVDVCWSARRHDPFCERLADDLRKREDARLLAIARSLPLGVLDAFDALLRHGAAKHGCEPHETGGGQTVEQHVIHASAHLWRADEYGPGSLDSETELLDVAHAMVRCALAVGLLTERGE